ncbi:MAM and LDL-receptor class A domain-containing protein 1 [Aplysia californica]|uniref:Metalloendopeptidase n=1 Tax=Aplysia californica TaxID=6500 RepID=A0ABM1VRV8_APLCA|nr:MAM and LDL-receptor class A domain-containing protein 1 [Aplysia californica]
MSSGPSVQLTLVSCLLALAWSFPMSMMPLMEANPDENRGVSVEVLLKEGDIVVETRRSMEFLYYKTWYNRTVPYEFAPDFSLDGVRRVKSAMFDIQNSTCIRFKRREKEVDYIRFVQHKQGCYSSVGLKGGLQEVSLGDGCLRHGTIIHEILHLLGLWHEHSRIDRNEYITVMWDNIPKEHRENFEIRNRVHSHEIFLSMPYDYGSVMHYSNNTFALDRHKPTLVSRQKLPPGVVMGQRVGLSPGDIDKLNALYRCDITNCSSPQPLKNGQIDGRDFSVGARVLYRCDSGYTLVGASERVCRDLGQWTGDSPACLGTRNTGAVHYCNFDRRLGRLCGWTQATDDNLDWTANAGSTLTEDTGPPADHTLNTRNGGYMYVEASFQKPDLKARLISPVLDFPSADRVCLAFFTYMYGSGMGGLTVYNTMLDVSGVKPEDQVFSLEGDQGQVWRQVLLDLGNVSQPFHVTIEARLGPKYLSDIAIDDVVVGDCSTFKPLALSGGLMDSIACSFDHGLCQFQQDKLDDLDWVFNTGKTSTFNTGPDCDPHNCRTGQYLYLESSSPALRGDTAKLKTPVITGEGYHCLSFYYHMCGGDMGSLVVTMSSTISGNQRYLWGKFGDQGNRWQEKHLEFIATEAYEIWFEGTKGLGYRSDMAIDSISIIPGRCSGALRFNCDFEQDMCGWTNATRPADTWDWRRHSAETGTPLTGPSGDRLRPNGYYLYAESSRTFNGDTARLISPTVSSSHQGNCFQFWYHMYGRTMGNLTVSYQSGNGQEMELWSVAGNQGNVWHHQSINITDVNQIGFNVVVQANFAGGSFGDIAIDDVSLQSTFCGS